MKTYWVSRDLGPQGLPNHIKVWDKEPRFVELNGVWAGKIFMGMFDVNDWGVNIPDLEQGECREVTLTFGTPAMECREPTE